MKTNPAMNGLWSPFNKKFAKEMRAHRAKFLPDDSFECNVLAKVVRHPVDGIGIPVGQVVEVIQVSPPQISDDPVWRRMKRPYLNAIVEVNGTVTSCNLESLLPV